MAPLRVALFRRLWLASLVFNVGHLVQVVASSWVILELTGSPLWVSVMVGAPMLPLLLLSLPAGAAADLLDRRRLLVASSAVMVVAAAGMSVLWSTGAATPGALVGLGLLLGVGVALFNPAWQALLPGLVPPRLVPGAVSLNSASGGVAFAVGPALGGLLVATAGPGWAFGLAALGYTAIVVTVLAARVQARPRDGGTMAVAIATGLRYLRFSQGYRLLLVAGALFGFTSAALRAMLPNLTSDVLHGTSQLYGLLLGAFGAGAVVGGLTRARGGRLLGEWMVPGSIVLFGAVGVLAGVSRAILLTAAAMFLAGVLWTWVLATLISTFQVLTPDWVRGRTMSAFALSVFGVLPLGSAVAGVLGDVAGAAWSLVVFSAAVIALGAVWSRLPLPVLERIVAPVVPPALPAGAAPGAGRGADSAPVLVVNTWIVEADEFEQFVRLLADLRWVRMSTGAYRWAAYRDAGDPRRISEVFMLHSWEQHLQQRRRLDTRRLAVIERAERFGLQAPPRGDHLIGLDVDRRLEPLT